VVVLSLTFAVIVAYSTDQTQINFLLSVNDLVVSTYMFEFIRHRS